MFDEQSRLDYIRAGSELSIMPVKKQIALFYGLSDTEEIDAIAEELEEEANAAMQQAKEFEQSYGDDQPEEDNQQDEDTDEQDDNGDSSIK